MIDFAYDADWTGLRNWTDFLAGLVSPLAILPLELRPFTFPNLFLSPFISLSFSFHIASVILLDVIRAHMDAYVHRCVMYMDRNILPRISSRDEEGFPLVSFVGKHRRRLASNERFVRSSRTYL